MAVSIAQYVDLLFKKLQGVAKTANSTAKSASNESIASPPLLRGDVVWMQADQIANTAQTISGITTSWTAGNSVQCAPDTTVAPIGGIRPTWLTNKTYWIPQEFGSTWLPKVFVGPAAAANIEATGTQIFAAGIGGVGEYFFDTQAGVLNFIGETIPTVLTAGNVVYVSGYTYSGLIGTINLPDGTTIGNLVIANTTITTNQVSGNIILEPTGNGIAVIDTTTGLTVPVGNTDQRPTGVGSGTVRFNTFIQKLEVYDGTSWVQAGSGGNVFTITNQTISPDGSGYIYTLNQDATSSSILLTINGINQTPDVDYSVTGNSLTMSTVPASTDIIQVRFLAGLTTNNLMTNSSGNAIISIDNSGDINLQPSSAHSVNSYGNILPTANVTYSLGSSTQRWKDLWLSGSTLTLGNIVIKNSTGNTISFYGPDGVTPATLSAANADLAEMYVADFNYTPGTVVSFGGDYEVTVSTIDNDKRVAGIVSTDPSFVMNSAQTGDHVVAVALTGRVATKVTGTISKGDMMVSNGDGTARAESNPIVGTVIGKALEDFDGSTGIIEVVVGRV